MSTLTNFQTDDRNARGVAKSATDHLRFQLNPLTVPQLERLSKAEDGNGQGFPVSGDVLARLSRTKTR